MGGYYMSKKEEADGLKRISVFDLKKWGYFEGYKYGPIYWTNKRSGERSSIGITVSVLEDNGYLRIQYTQTDNETSEKKDFDYKADLTTTKCHFGGKRYWFYCPLTRDGRYCGLRVGVLYKGAGKDRLFGCRHCCDLSYSSKNESQVINKNPMFTYMNLMEKLEKLESKIKRTTYAGKSTKKQRKLNKLFRLVAYYGNLVKSQNKL